MREHIDEPGSNGQPFRIDNRRRSRPAQIANRRDAISFDPNVDSPRRFARAVINDATPDDGVE